MLEVVLLIALHFNSIYAYIGESKVQIIIVLGGVEVRRDAFSDHRVLDHYTTFLAGRCSQNLLHKILENCYSLVIR